MSKPILSALQDGENSSASECGAPDFALSRSEVGDIGELAFEIEAQKRGWLVASCRGKCRDIDAIVKRPNLLRPVSVQVKTGCLDRKAGGYKITNGTNGKLYSAQAYDVLAAYLPDRDQWLFYTRAELGNRMKTSYLPSELRVISRKSCYGAHGGTTPDRDPDNWELLDEVAQSFQ